MRRSVIAIVSLVALVLLFAGPALAADGELPISFSKNAAPLAEVELQRMPAVDTVALRAAAELEQKVLLGTPMRFAEPFKVGFAADGAGTWETLADGSHLWRLRVSSPGAIHLNLGFSRFDLPVGARVWVYNAAGDDVEGPWDASHRSAKGRLWTPLVFGDEAVVEMHVPAGVDRSSAVLELGSVNHGFRFFDTKSGSCNNDTICPEGDDWRDEIRAAASYSIDGIFLCSGQLVNNTAQDDTPYFLSAFHCGARPENDDTLVFYWRFESPVCGQLGGGSKEINQTGSIFRAGERVSDFALYELTSPPPVEAEAFLAGWDATGAVADGSVGIHHPQGDEKAISFNDDALTLVDIGYNTLSHWEVDDWEDGTTEGGSSGSCLYDPATKHCVGVLTGGFASCTVIDADFYGALSVAWEAGAADDEQLAPWLDPIGGGANRTLDGKDLGSDGGVDLCQPSDTTLCLRNRRFGVEVDWTTVAGLTGPATVVDDAGNSESGLFWFFSSNNWEMLIKVLDGCNINGHFWVFGASATTVGLDVTVTDYASGEVWNFSRDAGSPAQAIAENRAFATCDM